MDGDEVAFSATRLLSELGALGWIGGEWLSGEIEAGRQSFE